MATDIRNSDNIIDSRDVIARIDELESEIADLYEQIKELEESEEACNDLEIKDLSDQVEELEQELAPLESLAEDASCYSSDWSYGEALISDDYFVKYAEQLAGEIGAVDSDAPWPTRHIDWEAAAEALKQDYTSVDFSGETYWIRAN